MRLGRFVQPESGAKGSISFSVPGGNGPSTGDGFKVNNIFLQKIGGIKSKITPFQKK
jgi:hypothetical protein